LASGEANVNELAEPFDMSLPAVSRHIRVLERAGLVTQGQRVQYRPIWEERINRMDSYLRQLAHQPPD
jgi:DNA-binding transcriptional ArsR family regulator